MFATHFLHALSFKRCMWEEGNSILLLLRVPSTFTHSFCCNFLLQSKLLQMGIESFLFQEICICQGFLEPTRLGSSYTRC